MLGHGTIVALTVVQRAHAPTASSTVRLVAMHRKMSSDQSLHTCCLCEPCMRSLYDTQVNRAVPSRSGRWRSEGLTSQSSLSHSCFAQRREARAAFVAAAAAGPDPDAVPAQKDAAPQESPATEALPDKGPWRPAMRRQHRRRALAAQLAGGGTSPESRPVSSLPAPAAPAPAHPSAPDAAASAPASEPASGAPSAAPSRPESAAPGVSESVPAEAAEPADEGADAVGCTGREDEVHPHSSRHSLQCHGWLLLQAMMLVCSPGQAARVQSC